MATHGESLVVLTALALIGGAVSIGVSHFDSIILRACFAFTGIYLVLAILSLLVITVFRPTSNTSGKRAQPPFIVLVVTTFVVPAMGGAIILVTFVLPAPDEFIARASTLIGAVASPFLVLGIGGSSLDSLLRRRTHRANQRLWKALRQRIVQSSPEQESRGRREC